MFISFEGIDFSGKSTQLVLLTKWLTAKSMQFLVVREPGGTEISERIRTILLDKRLHEMDAVTEMLLFSASRSQLITDRIIPALEAGIIVIADRFFDSTTAYQGFGRGIEIDAIMTIHRLSTHGIVPDVTFFFDIDVHESIRRRRAIKSEADRIESADIAFFERVREGYRWLSKRFPDRFGVINGTEEIEQITSFLIADVRKRLSAPT